ncbi:MAG: alpha/beta fold hydrolase [Pirellulaceae bacterium]
MSISFAHGCLQRTTADGTRFHYYDVGSGSVPVVLLHGLFGSPSNWQPIMQELAEHYRFLSLQLPIEPGKNRGYASFKSIGQLTDHVSEFLDEMELDRVVLCGNSLGGQVALDLCLRQPQRVERLILCGSAGLYERNLTGSRRPRLCRNYVRAQASEIFYDPALVSDELVDDILTMLSDRPYRRFLLRVAKATRDRYMLDELANVNVPTLIVWGREDTITPPFVAEQFCERIRNAELVFIDQCGHSPPIEQPDEFARLTHAFLADLTSDSACLPCKPR